MKNPMKIILSFASILLVSACAGAPRNNVDIQTPVASPATSLVHHYRCQSGATIAASYPSTDAATVHYKGRAYTMQIAVSGSGARYVGGAMEWWTKGSGPRSEGTLFRHGVDGTTADALEFCTAL